jgi:hypothetical protein
VNSTTYKLIACDGVLLVLGHVEVSDLDRGIGALGVGRLLGLLIVSLLVVALFGHLRLLSLASGAVRTRGPLLAHSI